MTITREQATEIAARAAEGNQPSYYTGPDFTPHPWVVDAVLEGANGQRGMTDEKIRQVLFRYELQLGAEVTAKRDGGRTRDQVAHLRGMIPQVRAFLDEGRREKAFRWLGFMQGALYSLGVYTIEQMADHNRPDVTP